MSRGCAGRVVGRHDGVVSLWRRLRPRRSSSSSSSSSSKWRGLLAMPAIAQAMTCGHPLTMGASIGELKILGKAVSVVPLSR